MATDICFSPYLGLGVAIGKGKVPTAAVASGPGSYSKSIYLDGTNDTLRAYAGPPESTAYENTWDEMEDFRDAILDPHNATWTWDSEFRPTESLGSSKNRRWNSLNNRTAWCTLWYWAVVIY